MLRVVTDKSPKICFFLFCFVFSLKPETYNNVFSPSSMPQKTTKRQSTKRHTKLINVSTTDNLRQFMKMSKR